MVQQREFDFHNTIPIEGEELEIAIGKAVHLQEQILQFFVIMKHRSWTPSEIWEVMSADKPVLLTSVRRAITNLTTAGFLVKCPPEEAKMGPYGVRTRSWRLNENR